MLQELQTAAPAGAAEPLQLITSAKVVENFDLDLDSVKRLRKKRAVLTVMLPNNAGKLCPHYDPEDMAAIVPCLENRQKLKTHGHLKAVSSATPEEDARKYAIARTAHYHEALRDVPAELLRIAFTRVANSHPWRTFPSVVELRRVAVQMSRGHGSDASAGLPDRHGMRPGDHAGFSTTKDEFAALIADLEHFTGQSIAPSITVGTIKLLRKMPNGELVYKPVEAPAEWDVIYTLAGASRESGIAITALKREIGHSFEDFRIYGGEHIISGAALTTYIMATYEANIPTPKLDPAYGDHSELCALVGATEPHRRAEVAEQKALWEKRGSLPYQPAVLQCDYNAVGKWHIGTDGKRVTTQKKLVPRVLHTTRALKETFKKLWFQNPTPYVDAIIKYVGDEGIKSADLHEKMLKMDIGEKRLRKLNVQAGVVFKPDRHGGRFVIGYDGPRPPMPGRAPGDAKIWLENVLLESGPQLWQAIVERARNERDTCEKTLVKASRDLECQKMPIEGKPVGGGRYKIIALKGQTLGTYDEGKRMVEEFRRLKARFWASRPVMP